ncbi:MAG TPA: hypothetical protein VEN99_04150, partial [Acidimicrobiia bacterium]|nr:hypothetical protein [Acidimicrobiia bacterium]
LAPRADEAPAPTDTPETPSPEGTTTTGRAHDLSPRAPRSDKADGGSDSPAPSPAAAVSGLPGELALSDIFPYTPTTAGPTAPPDAPPPTGPPPAGEAVADYGHAPHSHWPLLAGMLASLAVLVLGGGFVWWRNRDSRYWPA